MVGPNQPFSVARTSFRPHRNTTTVRISQGAQARHTAAGRCWVGVRAGGARAALASWLRSAGLVHSVAGCQMRRNATRHAIEISAEITSTSHGPQILLTMNCGTAKLTPVTRAAGHTPSMPRQPAKAHTSQNGTITLNSGNCRPTMAESA